MPDPIATISAEQLSKLTGFSVAELSKLARSGYFPRAKSGAYDQLKSIPGCFKAYADKVKEGGRLPIFQSMAEVEKQVGIPRSVLKTARKESAESFQAHRILLGPLLRWIFSRNGDTTNWGEHFKKFQALREEIRYQEDKHLSVSMDDVTVTLNKGMATLFAFLEKRSSQLPPTLKGRAETDIQKILVESDAHLKADFKKELQRLLK